MSPYKCITLRTSSDSLMHLIVMVFDALQSQLKHSSLSASGRGERAWIQTSVDNCSCNVRQYCLIVFSTHHCEIPQR